MATRQYIGARYVPKFYTNSVDGSTQWEANVVYEPLVYVTLTNGHMYISKKQVPATVGSPASNVEYWLDMGSYNGFIEQLQNEIQTLTTKVISNSFKCILIGDSFATIANSSGKTMFQLAKEISGRDCIISAVSGAGFTGTNTFLAQLQAISDDTAVKDIYVIGGANDVLAANATAIFNAISTFMTYAKTHFPNAKVHLGYAGYHWNMYNYFTSEHDMVIPAYKRIEELGGEFIKDFASVLHSDTLTYDSLHPTSDGVTKLGKQIGRVLCGLPVESLIEVPLTASDVTGASGVTVNAFYVDETINNDSAEISNYQGGFIQVDFSPAVTITTFTDIATANKNAIYPTENTLNACMIPCHTIIYHSDSSVTTGELYLMKKYDSYKINPLVGDFSNVVRLQFGVGTTSFPAIKV